MMSRGSSSPTEILTRSSPTPAAARSATDICWWVVLAGWITSVLASPTLARWEARRTAAMNLAPASRPPAMPKLRMAPVPLGYSLRASSWSGWLARDGYLTQVTASLASKASATASVLATWRCILSGSVSTPWRIWKALAGLMHAPKSRSPSARARLMKAAGPNSSLKLMPW